MDSDGQHPAERIADFMAASVAQPAAMILGAPQFPANAPRIRVQPAANMPIGQPSRGIAAVAKLGAALALGIGASIGLNIWKRR